MQAMAGQARSNTRPGRLLQQLPQCPQTPAGEQQQAQICRDLLSFMTKRNASEAARCRRIVDNLGSCGAVVELLGSPNTEVVEAAARCLQGLCYEHTDAVQEVSREGAVAHLAGILGRPWAPPSRGGVKEVDWWRVQLACAELLQNLTESDLDTVATVTEARVAPSLAQLVAEPGDGGVQLRLAACCALTNMTWASTEQQGELLRSAAGWNGFLPQLLHMLQPGAGEVEQEAAAALLWSLLRAKGEPEREFVAAGGTRCCISLMTGASSERLRVCCSAILAMLGLDMPNTSAAGSVLASGSWQSKRGGPTRCTLPCGAGKQPVEQADAAKQQLEQDQHAKLEQAWAAAQAPPPHWASHPLGAVDPARHSSAHARPF
jgi:hypothetical protein